MPISLIGNESKLKKFQVTFFSRFIKICKKLRIKDIIFKENRIKMNGPLGDWAKTNCTHKSKIHLHSVYQNSTIIAHIIDNI